MARRRLVLRAAGVTLAVLAGVFAQLPAGAQTATEPRQLPMTGWTIPGYEGGQFKDGMGTWLYVLPQQSPGPGQLSRDGYQYQLTVIFDRLRHGRIGVRTGPQGPVAYMEIEDLGAGTPKFVTEVAYDWSPGHFYFVYSQLLVNGDIGGWILDWSTGVWTYIGSLHPLVDWGKLISWAITSVEWAASRAAPATCSGYPRTDAYFFPPLGYTGPTFAIGTFSYHYSRAPRDGDCPARAEILGNGWVHYQVGV